MELTSEVAIESRLLAHLARGPASLPEVVEATGLPTTTAHRHLARLVAQRLVRKTGRGRATRFEAVPSLSVVWTDPARSLSLAWKAGVPISWRYPLVTRIPDVRARETLLRMLALAERRGLLVDATDEAPGIAWVVYGSCARGDAGAKSDLDLLILEPHHGSRKAAWEDLADDANLWASRSVDLHVVSHEGFDRLASGLRRAILLDGCTVFASRDDAAWIEQRKGDGR